MAGAMGFASLPPRGGIICPVTLGQRVPAQLCGSEGRGPGPGRPAVTSTCSISALVFDLELNRLSGVEVCCTVIFTNLLSNVENLPKIGPAALLSHIRGRGLLSTEWPASPGGQAEGGPPLVGGETCP